MFPGGKQLEIQVHLQKNCRYEKLSEKKQVWIDVLS